MSPIPLGAKIGLSRGPERSIIVRQMGQVTNHDVGSTIHNFTQNNGKDTNDNVRLKLVQNK
jgi:hypothetical protein